MISGQASFTQAQVEAIGQAMCSTNYSDAQASQAITSFSSMVSPAGLAAFSDCIKSTAAGLQLSISYDDNAPELVTISAHYVPPVGNPGGAKNFVHAVVIDSSAPVTAAKVTCAGPLFLAGQTHGELTTADKSMTCHRPVENDPNKTFPIAGKIGGIAFPASVSVPTDLGTIRFLYGALFLPPPVSPVVPAFPGEIRAVAFQSTDAAYSILQKNGWMECDGSVLKIEEYPELYKALGYTWGTSNIGTTFKLPNLQGQFLRGWSHGTTADPEAASRTAADPTNPNPAWSGSSGDHVGSQQADAFMAHTHTLTGYGYKQGFDPAGHFGTLGNTGGNFETTGASGKTSGAETRPKNVSIMYVIYTGKLPKS